MAAITRGIPISDASKARAVASLLLRYARFAPYDPATVIADGLHGLQQ